MQFSSFREARIQQIADDVVLKEIHQRMEDADFSQQIIDNTTIRNVVVTADRFTIFVTSELFTATGFDIALARERGTSDHFIAPREKKVLRWVEDGVVIFSAGHEVKGIQALMIIARTLDELESQLLDQFNLELQNWIDMNLGAF